MPLRIVEQPLTSYHPGWGKAGKPLAVVVHYSAGFNAESCFNALKAQGLSAHATVERDGVVYRHVADGNRSFHAGYGSWYGISNMNNHSLGVEIANLGWLDADLAALPAGVVQRSGKEVNVESDGHSYYRMEGKAAIVSKVRAVDPLDHRSWAGKKLWSAYAPEQLAATFELVTGWVRTFDILPENVIGHEHVDPARKLDPGPHFPWRELEAFIYDALVGEKPELFDPSKRVQDRVKTVQSHCQRMGVDVGVIDGLWGRKTEAGAKAVISRFGSLYGFSGLVVKQENAQEISYAFRTVPGFSPGSR